MAGFIIVGEDNTGKLDLGIFIASIVPDGPADKDGRIRPGRKKYYLPVAHSKGGTLCFSHPLLCRLSFRWPVDLSQ